MIYYNKILKENVTYDRLYKSFITYFPTDKITIEEFVNKKINFMIEKQKLIKHKDNTLSTNSKVFDTEYMYPFSITSLFKPLPVLMRRDYVFHLFYYNINPYSFYPEKHHTSLDNIHKDLLAITDELRPYIEFNMFKQQSQLIKENNEHLYNLLQEKVNKSQQYQLITKQTGMCKTKNLISKLKEGNIHTYLM